MTASSRVAKMTTHTKDLIAVAYGSCPTDEPTLKQLATMFDRIAIPPLAILNNNTFESTELKKTRAWLVATGILLEHDIKKSPPSDAEHLQENFEVIRDDANFLLKPQGSSIEEMQAARGDAERMADLTKRAAEPVPASPFDSIDPEKLLESIQRISTNTTRQLTLQLRNALDWDAYSIISGDLSSLDQNDRDSTTQHDVLKIVLSLPVPHENVEWQHIIEYRNDPDSQNRFRILKTCMSEIARGVLTPAQTEETLEYLINSYRGQMVLHGMHTNTKRLEVFVVSTADALAKYAAHQWSKASQSIFQLEPRKLALLEGESTTPGSEVAYVIDASLCPS